MSTYLYNLGLAFYNIVKKAGPRAALRFSDAPDIGYTDLNRRSNSLARFLLYKGVVQGDVVAIFNDKTPTAFMAMIACLKIGTCYTNIDTGSPVARLSKMIAICNPRLFFTPKAMAEKLGETGFSEDRTIRFDSEVFSEDYLGFDDKNLVETEMVNGNALAYLMFTSGSTGFPKAVAISHTNVLNFIFWGKDAFGMKGGNTEVLTNLNPMHFDNSVFDFYLSLFLGNTLIPIPEYRLKEPRKLLDKLNSIAPTIWFSVPSLLVYILKVRALRESDLPSLTRMCFGGEGFPKNQLRKLWNLLGNRIRFFNVYGPTECTCICSSYCVQAEDMADDQLLPLGRICPNFDFLIVDEKINRVPTGIPGELCLLGPNVGKGYYNDPQKTEEAFVPCPERQGYAERMYRTGDIVICDAAKTLRFLGRKDHQVKRMGYRIELEEIEAALGALSFIHENAVIFTRQKNEFGEILAYVVAEKTHGQKSFILEQLRSMLPPYMMPDDICFLDNLPKNQNGKIDRVRLRTSNWR